MTSRSVTQLLILILAALACNAPLGIQSGSGISEPELTVAEATSQQPTLESTEASITEMPADPLGQGPMVTPEAEGGEVLPTATSVAMPGPDSESAVEIQVLDESGPRIIGLSTERHPRVYDYAPSTDLLLYAEFPERGAGPSNLAVTRLRLRDVNAGEESIIAEDDQVVEAVFAPNGQDIAYLWATETTYELHWRASDGADTVLATEVLPTFSVSPDGTAIVFTRESNYAGLDLVPGVYVVDVATGEEHMVADADRAGAGASEDTPVWSADGTLILLPVYGRDEPINRVYVIAADGSFARPLEWESSLSGALWYDIVPQPLLGWLSDNSGFVGVRAPGMDRPESLIVVYRLNPELTAIVGGEVIADAFLLGWAEEGQSVWIQDETESQVVPIP